MTLRKQGFVRPVVGGTPQPGREAMWAVDMVREIDTLLSRFADQDRNFARAYNTIAAPLAAAVFTHRTTNGACALPYTGNIASVTRTGTGVYDVLFGNDHAPDTNYSVRAIAEWGAAAGVFYQVSAKAMTGFTLTFFTPANAAADPAADVHIDVKGMLA